MGYADNLVLIIVRKYFVVIEWCSYEAITALKNGWKILAWHSQRCLSCRVLRRQSLAWEGE